MESSLNTIDYSYELERYKSFVGTEVAEMLRGPLALAGFYHIGPHDMVRCYFCSAEIHGWEIGDEVAKEHRRWSPKCPLLKGANTDNIPLVLELEKYLNTVTEATITPPSATANRVDMATATLSLPTQEGNNLITSAGHYTITTSRQSSFPQFSAEQARLATFVDWPIVMHQKPSELSQAGFFYTGNSDKVRCFSCGVSLRNWEKLDDPFEQHAIWKSECLFLIIIKGIMYINEVKARAGDTQKTSKVSPVI